VLSRVRLFLRDYVNLIVTTESRRSRNANEDFRSRSHAKGIHKDPRILLSKADVIAHDYYSFT